MRIPVPLNQLDDRLCAIAERRAGDDRPRADDTLEALGLIDHEELTSAGEAYYVNRWVHQDGRAAKLALGDALKELVLVNTFCGAIRTGTVPTGGALRLVKRISRDPDDASARRWLELMNRADLIVYNRAHPQVQVKYRPDKVLGKEEGPGLEKKRGHILDPSTPYGNLLALRELLRSARGDIRWYEQHMAPKVLEVLYREINTTHVKHVKLLSGPANLSEASKEDFKRFRSEFAGSHVDVQWRVLDKTTAFKHHDRFFITEGLSRNLPPLNSILAGSVGEILPSTIGEEDFDTWWQLGTDLLSVKFNSQH